MQRVRRMLGNLIRASTVIQKLDFKTKKAQRWNDTNIHVVFTAALAHFPGSDGSIHLFTPGNLIALSVIPVAWLVC